MSAFDEWWDKYTETVYQHQQKKDIETAFIAGLEAAAKVVDTTELHDMLDVERNKKVAEAIRALKED